MEFPSLFRIAWTEKGRREPGTASGTSARAVTSYMYRTICVINERVMIIVLVISLAAAVVTPRLVVVGGGAAGFFGAIRAASLAPSLRVLLLEASPRCLTKVSISGGGRCNVCHDETKEVRQLASGYPRGERAMLGTFTKRFGAKDAAAWFRDRGVELKTEADGRMFPTTDDSATIVNALSDAARKAGVEVLTRCKVTKVHRLGDSGGGTSERFEVCYTADGGSEVVRCRSLLFATGGSREAHRLLSDLGVRIVPPVPSLFTLDLSPNHVTSGLAGISVPEAAVRLRWLPDEPVRAEAGLEAEAKAEAEAGVRRDALAADERGSDSGSGGGETTAATTTTTTTAASSGGRKHGGGRRKGGGAGTAFESTGPVLITHKGLSGPACLRLSAFAARELAEHRYRAEVSVSWAPHLNEEQAVEELRGFGARAPNKALGSYCPIGLPKRLWSNLVTSAGVDPAKTWAQLPKAELRRVAQAVVASKLRGVGKSTNKDEFVTAGGADLSQLHAHSFECKEPPGLFLAGEVLDVDGITGGYNFLNAWATSWCAGTEIARDVGAVFEEE